MVGLWLIACGVWITEEAHLDRVDADLDGVPASQDCDDADPDAAWVVRWFVDGDGDGVGAAAGAVASCSPVPGWVRVGGDCDDTDPAVVEPSEWFVDGDGDGAGGEAVVACGPPAGAVEQGGDCDDADPSVRPGGTEVCNGLDDDCDGLVDDADPGVVPLDWYRDDDGDGFGRAAGPSACLPPAVGWVTQPGDCDDGDPAVHPDALERCNGVDDDCDGLADDDDPDAERPTWYRDDDGDGWGVGSSAVQACVAPPDHVSAPGDCDDAEPFAWPREYEQLADILGTFCDGAIDHDCDGLDDDDDPDCADSDRDGVEDGLDPIRFVDDDDDGAAEHVCVRADLTVDPPWSADDAYLARSDVLEPDRIERGAVLGDAWCVDVRAWPPGVYAFRFVAASSATNPSRPVDPEDCDDWRATDLEVWCDVFGPADPACERVDLNACDQSRFIGIPYDLMAVEVDWDGERARPAE